MFVVRLFVYMLYVVLTDFIYSRHDLLTIGLLSEQTVIVEFLASHDIPA